MYNKVRQRIPAGEVRDSMALLSHRLDRFPISVREDFWTLALQQSNPEEFLTPFCAHYHAIIDYVTAHLVPEEILEQAAS